MRDMHLEFITIINLEGENSAYFVFGIVEESETNIVHCHQQQRNTHAVVVVCPRHLGDTDGKVATLKTKWEGPDQWGLGGVEGRRRLVLSIRIGHLLLRGIRDHHESEA